MRIGLTGAAGFIGSYTARALAKAGHQVIGLVRDPQRAGHVVDALSDVIVGNFQDAEVQERLCRRSECIVHAAADWDALRSDNRTNVEVNLLGSLGLLEAARRGGVKQFIFFSSVSAYHEILADRKRDENHPTWPGGQYGACKAGLEPFLKAYHFEYGMNTVSLRPGGVYGMAHRPDISPFYPLVRQVMEGRAVDTAVGGKIVHVLDCADAVRLCVGNAAVAGRFFTLVDCYVYDQEVAEMAREICGSSCDIVNRKGSGPRNNFDVSAARSLGVALNRGKAGVEEYVEELVEATR